MQHLKRIVRKLLYPHVAILSVLVPTAIVLLTYSFAATRVSAWVSYFAYVLSAYTLVAVCVRAPRIWHAIQHESRCVQRWKSDPRLRVKISLYGALAMNVAYAFLQLGLGITHKTVWFFALFAYYALLIVMRFALLRYIGAHSPGEDVKNELFRYRLCGIVLVAMNLVLGVIVFYITWQNRTFHHHQITTIAMAAYTFTALTLSIVGSLRYRKYQSPAFSAVKAVGLTSALVSMLTLESAMLTAFGGEGDAIFQRLMTGLSGAAVVLFVLVMAIGMILRATRALREIEFNKTQI